MNSVVSEKLMSVLETTLSTHRKYVEENVMSYKIIMTELVVESLMDLISGFKVEFGIKLDDEFLREKIKTIIKNVEAETKTNLSALLVYDCIKIIWNTTDQSERQMYFNNLIELYNRELVKIIPTLTQQNFWSSIKLFLQYIKLEYVVKFSNENRKDLNLYVGQVLEFLSCPRLSREDCYQIVFNTVNTSEYKLKSFRLKPLENAHGFLGDHFKLNITIEINAKIEELRYFAKFNTTRNEICGTMAARAANKENFFYNQFIPLINKFDCHQLSDGIPKCYFCRINDVMVLDDLSLSGFKSSNIRVPVDLKWMVKVVKQLAKFHACSLVLDKKLSQQIGSNVYVGDLFGEYVKEINFDKTNDNCWFMYFGGMLISDYFIDKVSHICQSMSLEDFKSKARIKVEETFENLKRSKSFYNVICHGDLYGGNIMTNSKNDCLFIDFQMLRYCPPAVDLLFTIYINSDRQFRLKYMEKMVRIYYESLKHYLKIYDIELDEFYSKENMFESFKVFKATGIIQSLSYLQILLCPERELEEINNDDHKARKFFNEDRFQIFEAAWEYEPFKTRMTDLIQDLHDVCLE